MSTKVHVMPDFQPNEYLFETHADKGADRWEIYAWAVRDAMAKVGRLNTSDMPLKIKIQYEKHMQMQEGAQDPLKNEDLEQYGHFETNKVDPIQ